MNSYLITYELNEQSRHYQALTDKIISLGVHYLCYANNVWIITSELPPNDITAILKQYIYQNDSILVIRLVRNAGWEGLSQKQENWLNDYL